LVGNGEREAGPPAHCFAIGRGASSPVPHRRWGKKDFLIGRGKSFGKKVGNKEKLCFVLLFPFILFILFYPFLSFLYFFFFFLFLFKVSSKRDKRKKKKKEQIEGRGQVNRNGNRLFIRI
jgi:hypothetical protein